MNYLNPLSIGTIVLSVVLGAVALLNFTAANSWEQCYSDAIANAEDTQSVVAGVADTTVSVLTGVIIGDIPHPSILDPVLDDADEAAADFDEIVERCG